MANVKTAVVDPVTGMFCEDGMAPGRIVVSVEENPDPQLHRYSGDPLKPLRLATPAEQTAATDADIETRLFAQVPTFEPLMQVVYEYLPKETKPATYEDFVVEVKALCKPA